MFCCLSLVPKELPIPLLNRTNNGKDIDVVWNPISPNRTAGEGYVHRYDIRYYQYEDVDNSIVVSVDNVTQYKIQGVDEDTEYTVQVRVVVLKSTEPTQTFEFGEWGGILVPKPVGEFITFTTYITLLSVHTHNLWIQEDAYLVILAVKNSIVAC